MGRQKAIDYATDNIDRVSNEREQLRRTPKELVSSIDVNGPYWTPNPYSTQVRAGSPKYIETGQTNFAGEMAKNVQFFSNVQNDATRRMINGMAAFGRRKGITRTLAESDY